MVDVGVGLGKDLILDELEEDAEVMVTFTSETERVSSNVEAASFENIAILEAVVCSRTLLEYRDTAADLVIVVFPETEFFPDTLVIFLVLVERVSLRVLENSSDTAKETTTMDLCVVGTTDGQDETDTLILCWQTAGAKGNKRNVTISSGHSTCSSCNQSEKNFEFP